jgi:hypothetical protein
MSSLKVAGLISQAYPQKIAGSDFYHDFEVDISFS